MNKNFELSKILATLTGLIIIGSGLFFGSMTDIRKERIDLMKFELEYNAKYEPQKAVGISTQHLDEAELIVSNTGWGSLILSIFFGLSSMYYAFKGYNESD